MRPETRAQNLDPLVGGIPTYVPNPPLDCNTELFNHTLETIWGEISRERDRGVGRQTGVEAEQTACVPEPKALAKTLGDLALPFMKQKLPHTQNSGLGHAGTQKATGL